MNEPTYERLKSSAILDADGISMEEANRIIERQLEAMKLQGEIVTMTDEELRMVESFRSFKAKCRPGAVFKWQTRPAEDLVVTAPERSLIVTPQEAPEIQLDARQDGA